MVQSINTKAIVTLASIVRRPGLLVPHISVHTLSELNFTAMKQDSGIQAVVFDKDNTLTAPYENVLHPAVVPGLRRAIETFGKDNVAILSNSAGTRDDLDYKDAIEIEAALGIKVIRHDEKKPGGLQEMLHHFQLEDPATICIVGDRILTDIVFGNLYGLLTVHCLPLCQGPENVKDNWTAKLLRPVENSMLYSDWFGGRILGRRRLSHKYWKGTSHTPLLLENHDNKCDR
jgi:phosphatidylglycerophosphatase GEP4